MEIRKNIICLLVYLLLVTFAGSRFCFANTFEENNNKPKLERILVTETAPLNLEELTNAADRIFTGYCIKVEEIENDNESKLPVIKYKFKIVETIKGAPNKKEIAFKQWKYSVREAPFQKGKKYVVFLHPGSERGLTSPVGFLQGRFDIESRGLVKRNEFVRNKLGNRGLAKNLKTRKEINISNDKFINDYIYNCSENGAPIRYKEFVKAVRYLVSKNE